MATTAEHHRFHAVAFAENFVLKEIAALFPTARPEVEGLRLALEGGGAVFFYPFGAVVFANVERPGRDEVLARLPGSRRGHDGLKADVIREEFLVQVAAGAKIVVAAGTLELDRYSPEREGVVALTVAQSAAMEYYERIVEQLFARTTELVAGLELKGKVPLAMRRLHRFIGEAMSTRLEVLAVVHLLDKPEAVWDDPGMDLIYSDLRDEFDLGDRFDALEIKLKSVQEALTLLLDSAKDRRIELLEIAIVALIVFEIVLSLAKL